MNTNVMGIREVHIQICVFNKYFSRVLEDGIEKAIWQDETGYEVSTIFRQDIMQVM